MKELKKKKKIVKKAKEKPQVRAVIDKDLARALQLSVCKESSQYSIGGVFVNAETREIVATDSYTLLVIKPKLSGLVPSALLNLGGGLYGVIEDILLRKDIEEKDIQFPKYQDVISAETKQVCKEHLLRGVIYCIAKKQVAVDVWRFEKVLKALSKYAPGDWTFFNDNPNSPVMMTNDGSRYSVKYVIMPINMG